MKILGILLSLAILILAIGIISAQQSGELCLKWSADVVFPVTSSLPEHSNLVVADNGDVAISLGKYPSHLLLLDGSTGEIQWEHICQSDFIGSLAISPAGDRILVMDSMSLVLQTESVESCMKMLDENGQVLWEREANGASKMSPTGQYILAYNSQINHGLRVFDSSDGTELWAIPAEKLSKVETADFTLDSQKILVHCLGEVRMYNVIGDLLWYMTPRHFVYAASTSNDGSITAMLTGGITQNMEQTKNLIVLNENGERLSLVELLRSAPFDPPSQEHGDWYWVGVSGDGTQIVVAGILRDKYKLVAFNPLGNPLWEQYIDINPLGSSSYLKVLPAGDILFAVISEYGTRYYRMDGYGRILESIEMPNAAWPKLSLNYKSLVLIAGQRVNNYILSTANIEFPTARELKFNRVTGSHKFKLVPLRQLLSKEWHVTYNETSKEAQIIANDGKYIIKVTAGSNKAVVNGKMVLLSATPYILNERILVPDSMLDVLKLKQTLASLP